MNALSIAKTGTITKIVQAENGQPSSFIYSGQQWLPINDSEHTIVSNLAELNQLSAKPGDLIGVLDAGDGQHEHFFYADGEWKKQIRGGDAGQIVIKADKLQVTNNSEIATASVSGGGGNVTLNVDKMVFLTDSQITTSVQEGAGNGGDLTISGPQFVIMNDGEIIAQAYEGRGGNIRLGSKQLIKSPCSQISASSKLGIDGNVNVESPIINMDDFLVVLPGARPEAKFSTRCQFEDWDDISTFVTRIQGDGRPRLPDNHME